MEPQKQPPKRSAPASRTLTRTRGVGHLLRLWRPPLQPSEWHTLGLFAAPDDRQLEEVLASMPLRVWRTDEVTPLSPHGILLESSPFITAYAWRGEADKLEQSRLANRGFAGAVFAIKARRGEGAHV
jgi:muconolactone delta-isomerase